MSVEELRRAAQLATHWETAILSTAPVDAADVTYALDALFTEVGLTPPEELLSYASPAAAWAAAKTWLPRVRRVLVFPWAWALPTTDPQFVPKTARAVDLGARRRWDRGRGPKVEPPPPGARGALISREVLRPLWRCVMEQVRSDPYAGLLASMSDDLDDALFDMEVREDATNQLAWPDWVQLGPLRWAARECAMLEIIADVLGCRVRSEYRAAVAGIVERCGLVLAFDSIAIACDRPRQIRPSADGLVLTFSDGTSVQTRRRPLDVV